MLKIFADGKKLEGRLSGIESADGEMKVNLLYNNIKRSRHYKVKNQILTDIH
jgi:hypothetical protein